MEFKAKVLDMDLELIGSTGEKKTFTPFERITGKFAERLIREMTVYVAAQNGLPDTEQDNVVMGNLKFLSWMYKDFNSGWVLSNFNNAEISEIKNWAFVGLNGIKKDGES